MTSISELLDLAYARRNAFIDENHNTAFRLFNGFLEGSPNTCVDIYARTALIHNYSLSPADDLTANVRAWVLEKIPWVECILVKLRSKQASLEERTTLVFGRTPNRKIFENGVWYALDLTMNRDASFYLDTRLLRAWAKNNLIGKTVLNTFAYTGSLGVAALAGGAAQVVQLDRNARFLDLARQSYALNDLPFSQKDFLIQDFFPAVSHLKQNKQTFDCVFLDPPFFASTPRGTVDLETGSTRLINKIRPLINNGGWLVAINNALFVSGQDYYSSLESLCVDGYLSIEKLIPVPPDFAGFDQKNADSLPSSPSPFNHSTKIAILRVSRKSMLAPFII